MKLLVVSGDRLLHRQVEDCLSTLGLQKRTMWTASSEQECLHLLNAPGIRLVILDDGTKGVNAPKLLAALHRHAPSVLVLYVAAAHTFELERQIRQSGVLYYTQKPCELDSLRGIVGAVFTSERRSYGPAVAALPSSSR